MEKEKRQITTLLRRLLVPATAFLLVACYPDESLNTPVTPPSFVPTTDLDLHIEENFTKEFGIAIRYRFVDRFVQPTQRVTPPKLSAVRPMLDFIEQFWIDPFLEVQNGEAFFRNYVPAEIILLGGLIYNDNGTVVLGTADAGARITFTDVNSINPSDKDWETLQLQTVYHEFAHIVHQRHRLPAAFEQISPKGYTSPGFWPSLSQEDALIRGFVSPYATSSPNEDFAETVAFYLYNSDFMTEFMQDEPNCANAACEARNLGREMIREKVVAIQQHYTKVVNINLEEVRNAVQSKLK